MERLNTCKSIEGLTLSSLIFVEDYVQLQVADATLTLGVLPIVKINQDLFFGPDREGYCDSLRSQIGKTISGVYSGGDRKLFIVFADDSQIILSREDNPGVTEMLVFEKAGEPIVVW